MSSDLPFGSRYGVYFPSQWSKAFQAEAGILENRLAVEQRRMENLGVSVQYAVGIGDVGFTLSNP